MQTCTILTNDPSMRAWGWAILTCKGKVLASGCIKTEPGHKKKRIRVSDDTTSRAGEITRKLIELVKKYNVRLILSEAPHGSQNAKAAVMIGLVTGITVALSECLNIPIEYYSEQDAKKAVLNKRAATKDEMVHAIEKLYDTVCWKNAKYKDEAIADALAVHYVASQLSPLVKMLKNETASQDKSNRL